MRSFEPFLLARREFRNFTPSGDNWLGIYSVTTAALADAKVVVREVARGMIAAPVHGSDVIPDHKLYVIPCQSRPEADLLALVLNSEIVDFLLRAFAISTSITGSFLNYIGIRNLGDAPQFDSDSEAVAYALGLTTEQHAVLRRLALDEANELGIELGGHGSRDAP
jgi:hypothetical protein